MKHGVTLVELVLAIGLAGILGIPTGLLLGEHLNASLRTRDSNLATQLARYEMERLDSLNNFFATPDLTVGPPIVIPNYQGYAYTLTRTVTCQVGNCTSTSTTSQGIKRIQIAVTKSDSTEPLANLISYRAKCVCFGSPPPLVLNSCSNACRP